MRILITGACGLLGAHLMACLSRQHEVRGVDRHPWWGDKPADVVMGDLTVPGFLIHIVEETLPNVLIHCAAMANVDACEQNPTVAYTVNAMVTQRLVQTVSPACLVVYISTDGLFRGTSPFATEEQLPCPRTVYGRSKLHGEWEVQQATDNHLIIRTNFYGWSSGRKQTAGEWLYDALEKGHSMTLVDDFFFTPIYVVDLARRLEILIQQEHRGIFHVAGKERVSKSQFGILLAEAAGFSLKNVRRGSLSDAPLVASRPRDMSLDSSRFHRLVGVEAPDCLAGLRCFLKDRSRLLSARLDSDSMVDTKGALALRSGGKGS